MEALKMQKSVVCSLVYAPDEFSINTDAKMLRHRPVLYQTRSFADVVGGYAYAIDHGDNISAIVHVPREAFDAATNEAPRAWANYPEQCAQRYMLAQLEALLKDSRGT